MYYPHFSHISWELKNFDLEGIWNMAPLSSNVSDILAFSIHLHTKCVFLVMFRPPLPPCTHLYALVLTPPPPLHAYVINGRPLLIFWYERPEHTLFIFPWKTLTKLASAWRQDLMNQPHLPSNCRPWELPARRPQFRMSSIPSLISNGYHIDWILLGNGDLVSELQKKQEFWNDGLTLPRVTIFWRCFIWMNSSSWGKY